MYVITGSTESISKPLSKLVCRRLISVFIQPSNILLLISGCVFVLVFIQYDLIFTQVLYN